MSGRADIDITWKGFDTKELSLTVPRIGSAMSTGSATPDFGGHPSGE
jgi:hypothetical protein